MSEQEPLIDNPSARPSAESPSRKTPASERRIQANRRNALRSTGPKTERGKSIVARNAIKHGVLAREVVITAGDGKEDLGEFHDLVERLCEQYEPVGVVEESLVQSIATSWWRKARVIRAENGELRKRLDLLAEDRELQLSYASNFNVGVSEMDLDFLCTEKSAKISPRERWSILHEVETGLRGHYSGLEYLSGLLRTAKSEILKEGYISEDTRAAIVRSYFFSDWHFAASCSGARRRETTAKPSPSSDVGAEEADRRSAFAAYIDRHLQRLSELKELVTKREDLAVDADARRFSLPPADATDNILRYEAHLDRQLYRAMDQLERLQRQRKGEAVPPPLNINWGRRG
jgi:hypothetical protein